MLLRLVDDLLDVQRLASGRLPLDLQLLNFRNLIHDCIQQVQPLVTERNHNLQLETPDSEVTIVGDKTRLGQVLMNMLQNAIKFTPDRGRIIVRVRDFVMESVAHTESVLIVTKRGSTVRKVVEDEKRVEFVEIQPDLMLTPLLEKHREGPLNIVYDNLTDLMLLTDPQSAYRFVQNSIGLLSDPRVTVLFLFNPAAHEQRDAHGLRGLLSDQVTHGKQGASTVRMALRSTIDPSFCIHGACPVLKSKGSPLLCP